MARVSPPPSNTNLLPWAFFLLALNFIMDLVHLLTHG